MLHAAASYSCEGASYYVALEGACFVPHHWAAPSGAHDARVPRAASTIPRPLVREAVDARARTPAPPRNLKVKMVKTKQSGSLHLFHNARRAHHAWRPASSRRPPPATETGAYEVGALDWSTQSCLWQMRPIIFCSMDQLRLPIPVVLMYRFCKCA